MSPPRNTTVYDVADRAGVSIATVSRVLKDHPNVAEDTRARVRTAIEALDWRPSPTARALAARTHGAVAIVFPDLSGPYYAEVIRGFERQSAHRAAVHILATHARANAEHLVRDLAQRVDGLVIMGRTVGDQMIVELVADGLPVVLLARAPMAGAPAIRCENRASARALAHHLLDHGHRDLVFFGDPDGTPDVGERFAGLSEAFEAVDAGPPTVVTPSGYDVDHGSAAFRTAWQAGMRPTAVAAANDQLATGVCAAAAVLGLSVGMDLAVTGWDDQAMAALVTPGLTTVRQPIAELGSRAADCLFAWQRDGRRPESTLLPTRLVVRNSCGCSTDGHPVPSVPLSTTPSPN